MLDLLTVTLAGLSVSPRRQARMIIEGTHDEAVKAGKLREHHADGIELSDNGTKHDRTDFVFSSHAQVSAVADAAGVCVWLRGCGLRIEEALAVKKADFRESGDATAQPAPRQTSPDKNDRFPLCPPRLRDDPVDGDGLRLLEQAHPDGPALYAIRVPRCRVSPRASFPPRLTATQLPRARS